MQKLQYITLQGMILWCFDTVSVYQGSTKGYFATTGLFWKQHYRMLEQTLTSTYYLYSGKFYNQIDRVTMGLPHAPAVAYFNMEHFEQQALDAASLILAHWHR